MQQDVEDESTRFSLLKGQYLPHLRVTCLTWGGVYRAGRCDANILLLIIKAHGSVSFY